MSIQAMAWALHQQLVTDAPTRHVLLCLANYAGQDGNSAFPSAEAIARDTGLSERTVRAKLGALESSGLIRRGNQAIAAAYIARVDRRPIVYDLALERGASVAPRKAVTGCSSRTNGVQLTSKRGAGAAPDPKALSINDPAMDKNGKPKANREAEARGLKAVQDLLAGITP